MFVIRRRRAAGAIATGFVVQNDTYRDGSSAKRLNKTPELRPVACEWSRLKYAIVICQRGRPLLHKGPNPHEQATDDLEGELSRH